jgi:hypothetical protein
MNLLQGSMASIEPLKCKKVNASKTLRLPLHAYTLFLFSSFAPYPLHSWKVVQFCENCTCALEEKKVFIFDISTNYRQFECFWFMIMKFHCSLCFIDSFVLHLVITYVVFRYKAHLWSKGGKSYFSLFTLCNCCVHSSFHLLAIHLLHWFSLSYQVLFLYFILSVSTWRRVVQVGKDLEETT